MLLNYGAILFFLYRIMAALGVTIWKINYYLNIFACFKIISTQSGQVLCNHDTNFSCFNIRHHSLETVALEGSSTHAIVNIKLRVRKSIILCVPKQHGFLR